MTGMRFALEKLEFMGLNSNCFEFQLPLAAEGCKPGRRVQTWQKGANLAEGCKRCKKSVSRLHFCTFTQAEDESNAEQAILCRQTLFKVAPPVP